MSVKPIPDGFHTVTPYLIAVDAAAVVEFLKNAFGAVELERLLRPDGSVAHAEVRIGDSMVMFGGAMEGFPAQPISLYLFFEDCDEVYARAVAAGGVSLMEPANQFYGHRLAGVRDPAGNSWWIATQVENVSREEMERRMAALG